MCLYLVSEKTKQTKFGWKVFEKYNNGFSSPYYKFYFNVGEWIKDSSSYKIKTKYYEEYEAGFHFFYYEKDAKRFKGDSYYVIKKVEVDNIVASGFQKDYIDYLETGVAKRIRIVKTTWEKIKDFFSLKKGKLNG